MKTKLLLLSLLILGFLFRVISLSSIPSGFQNDEASFYVNAIALKQTGQDEDGRKFPVYLNSFLDPKPTFFSYLIIPFTSITNDPVTATRLPSVFIGTASILVAFILVKKLSSEKFALLTVFLLVISPWHIINSRTTQEVILSFLFSLLAILFLVLTLQDKKNRLLFLLGSLICAAISMYVYHSAKVFLPVFLPIMSFIILKNQHTKRKMLKLIGLTVFYVGIAAAITLSSSKSLTRFGAVGILSDSLPQLVLEEQIRVTPKFVPIVLTRMFHNKIESYGLEVTQKYFEQFSPISIFLSGEEPARYKIPFHGLMYLIEVIPLFFGLYAVCKEQGKKKTGLIMLFWLLIAPLPAAITFQESPSSIRTFLMIIPILWFVTYGLREIWKIKNSLVRKVLKGFVIFGYLWGIGYFGMQLVTQQPYYHPWTRNYADQIMVQKLEKYKNVYKHIVITSMVSGQPYVYVVIQGIIDISALQRSYPARTLGNFTLGKVSFASTDCPLEGKPDTLYLVLHSCSYQKNYVAIDSANYLDGAEAYDFVTLKK